MKLHIICLFATCAIIACNNAAAVGIDDINRLNFGVLFKFLKHEYIINRIWRHTFVFDLPHTMVPTQHHDWLTTANTTDSRGWYIDCIHRTDRLVNPNQANSNDQRGGPHDSGQDLQLLCDKIGSEISASVKIIREHHDILTELVKEITIMLPREVPDTWFNQSTETQSTKTKRSWTDDGLIPIIGKAASGLFGLATNEQLNIVAKHMTEVIQMTKDHTKMFEQATEDLSSFSKAVSKRMDGIVKGIREQALNTHEVLSDYRGALDVTKTKMELIAKTKKLCWELEKTRQHLQKFKSSLQLLNIGVLPSDLITPAMIQETINEIKKRIVSENYHIVLQNPLDYYKQVNFLHATGSDHLMITVDFPLSRYRERFRVYEVVLSDMTVPQNKDAVMRLKTEAKGLMFEVQRNDGLYAELSEIEVWEMKKDIFHHKERRVIGKDWGKSCLMSIYRSQDARVRKFCTYQIIPGKLEPSITWLTNDDFLVTAINEYSVVIDQEIRNEKGCQQCILTIPHNGEISTDSFLLNGGYGTSNETEYMKHTINKPLIAHFFSETELRMIKGDTTFEEIPQLTLPQIRLERPNETNAVAEDVELKLDMDKAMEAVKGDSVVIHTLADKVYWDGKLETKYFASWMDWATVGLGIIVGLLALQLIVVTSRLRSMALALAVLEQGYGVSGQTLNLNYPSAATKNFGQAQNGTAPLITLQGLASLPWLWFAAGFGIGLSCALLLWIILNRCKENATAGTIVALNIGSRGRGRIIKLLKYHVTISDLEVRVHNAPSGLTVKGCLMPTLQFFWDGQVLIKSLNVTETIPQCVRITMSEARALRSLIDNAYLITPIFVEGEMVKTIPNIPKQMRQTPIPARRGSLRGSRRDSNWSINEETERPPAHAPNAPMPRSSQNEQFEMSNIRPL